MIKNQKRVKDMITEINIKLSLGFDKALMKAYENGYNAGYVDCTRSEDGKDEPVYMERRHTVRTTTRQNYVD